MTNAEFSILSLVAEQPRHGYQIEQIIEQRGMRQWTQVGFSSIYYLLGKLERKSLVAVTAEVQDGRGPARKVFGLTTKGERVFQEAIRTALSEPQPCYPSILLGLSALPRLDIPSTLEALVTYRANVVDQRRSMRQNKADQPDLPYFVEAMFDYSEAMMAAELDWLDRLIQRVEQEHDQS
ncbi:MAG: PadR family transcriptional regulator [Anaerolineales bacterium]